MRMQSRWHVFLSCILLTTGCAPTVPFVWVDDLSAQAFAPTPYRIHPGDFLSVNVWNQPNLSSDVRVRPDGIITLPLLGDVAVSGLTPISCATEINRRLDGIVLEPNVTVTLREVTTPTVSVIGEVRRVGEYPLTGSDNVVQILARAGGLTEFAKIDRIFVIRESPKAVRIRFNYEELTQGLGRGLSFRLRDGDVLLVQ